MNNTKDVKKVQTLTDKGWRDQTHWNTGTEDEMYNVIYDYVKKVNDLHPKKDFPWLTLEHFNVKYGWYERDTYVVNDCMGHSELYRIVDEDE